MEIKKTLLQQYDRCYNENGWFVAVRNAIEGVTAEQAAWKPEGSDNSIWGSLTHISYYNNAYLQRFKGIEFQYDVSENEETFRAGEPTEEAWRADVEKFDSVMTEWRKLIDLADESKFSEPVPTNTSRVWADVIADVNAHNAYHGGQIVLLRKLQGSWSREKGVS